MSNEVIVEKAGGLLVITINRPEQRNAVNRAVSWGVRDAVDELDRDPALRVGILTGAGGTFCSGMDLKAFARGETPKIEGRGILGIARTPPKKPLIAAVEGYALAGGFECMLACDLAVVARDAKFGLPEAKRGLAAGTGLVRLPRLIPHRVALELALTGDIVGVDRLAPYGLFNAVVEPGETLARAKELAARVMANAPLAVAATKQVMVEQRNWSADEVFDRQEEFTYRVLGSRDAQEGAAAFAERRSPVWTGE